MAQSDTCVHLEFTTSNGSTGDKVCVKVKVTNFKSILLEHSQSVGTGVPKYVVISAQGPDHHKDFVMERLGR